MIVSASYKTDIPAFYGDWFMSRLREGRADVRNPYGGKTFSVNLRREAVDGFVFWTRNLVPFEQHLETLAAHGYPFIVQYTVIGYPTAIDRSVPSTARAVDSIRRIADRFGPRCAVWRYDPVLISSLTPPSWHVERFAGLAGQLAGYVDEVVASFAQIYRKTARNLSHAAREGGYSWADPSADEKRALLASLATAAANSGIRLTLCGQPDLLPEGVSAAACIDARRLSDVAGGEVPALHKPHRKECGCWQSRDIGGYDTCPHGCAYCYAVSHRERAKEAHARHDPGATVLG